MRIFVSARFLSMVSTGTQRRLTQSQYREWPDMGIPQEKSEFLTWFTETDSVRTCVVASFFVDLCHIFLIVFFWALKSIFGYASLWRQFPSPCVLLPALCICLFARCFFLISSFRARACHVYLVCACMCLHAYVCACVSPCAFLCVCTGFFFDIMHASIGLWRQLDSRFPHGGALLWRRWTHRHFHYGIVRFSPIHDNFQYVFEFSRSFCVCV